MCVALKTERYVAQSQPLTKICCISVTELVENTSAMVWQPNAAPGIIRSLLHCPLVINLILQISPHWFSKHAHDPGISGLICPCSSKRMHDRNGGKSSQNGCYLDIYLNWSETRPILFGVSEATTNTYGSHWKQFPHKQYLPHYCKIMWHTSWCNHAGYSEVNASGYHALFPYTDTYLRWVLL